MDMAFSIEWPHREQHTDTIDRSGDIDCKAWSALRHEVTRHDIINDRSVIIQASVSMKSWVAYPMLPNNASMQQTKVGAIQCFFPDASMALMRPTPNTTPRASWSIDHLLDRRSPLAVGIQTELHKDDGVLHNGAE